MIISAILSAPFGFVSIFFVPEYWDPVRIASFLTGLEDIIFSFANGGIVWLFAVSLFSNHIIVDLNLKKIIERYIICGLLGELVFLMFWLSGHKVMTSSIMSVFFIGIIILFLKPKLFSIFLVGLISFTIFYILLLKLSFIIWPSFLNFWNFDNLIGTFILGMPVEEILWAAGFGAVWPVLMAYILDARIAYPLFRKKNKKKSSFIFNTVLKKI